MKRVTIVVLFLLFSVAAFAANNCVFATVSTTSTLQGDCTTDASIIVADGVTMDLGGHTITGKDPSGGHFLGGILQSGGATAYVTNGTIQASGLADVCDDGADRLRGVLFDGASGSITRLNVLNINQGPSPSTPSGCQEGNGIEVRNFGSSPTTLNVTIDSNTVAGYEKTGIIVNGDSFGIVTNNTVTGAGPQAYIAQNGIQIGYGAVAQLKGNTVTGNSYAGSSTVSGGIIVVAGPYYGSDYSVGDQIQNNTTIGNDIGVWLTQIDENFNPPAIQTNVKVTGNTITDNAVTNQYVYQAGIADQGNNDKLINNKISGAGYNPNNPCGCLFQIDADTSFTNHPKVHANK